jgi:hypothetical protein
MSDIGKFSVSGLTVWTRDGLNVKVIVPFTFTRPGRVGGEVIEIPTTDSDGASVPRALSILGLTPYGPWWMGSVVHDYLYRHTDCPKEVADLIFYEAMIAGGTPEILARDYYNGVDQAGHHAFDKDREGK